MKRTTAFGLTAGGALISGATLFYSEGGSSQAPPSGASYSISAEATPREVDEGGLVEFWADVRSADPTAMDFPLYKWDFDDGSAPVEELDLTRVNHRFVDGKDRLHRVTLRIEDAEHELFVGVRNVPPTLHRVEHVRPALPGSAVTFDAAATDPGIRDTLTYTWDFGDGGTARGQEVRHTFKEAGRYAVTVTVDDGDGGEDRSTVWVIVGEVGSFQVTGDVTLPETKIDTVTLMGVKGGRLPGGSDPAGSPGLCQFRLAMGSAEGPPGFVLTAAFRSGLGERKYVVGTQNEWDGQVRDEISNPDMFYASLGVPQDLGRGRNRPDARPGPFWSQSGYVDVEYFDGKYLEVSFDVTLREFIPDALGPRTVVVRGGLAQRVERSIAVRGMFSDTGAATARFYMCDQDKAEKFDIAEQMPKPETQNVDGREAELTVRFTKPVDPATVARNVQLEYGKPAGASEGVSNWPISYHPVPGTWERVSGDDHSIRFLPQAHLYDAVIHCLRVRAGRQGIRGLDGEVLEPAEPDLSARTEPACANNRPWPESREWAFSTLVEFHSIGLDVYQVSKVSDNVPLVPGKPAVGRVYPIWLGRHTTTESGVNDWSQVKRFPARVTVEADGRAVGVKRVSVSRPDQFTDEDRRQARNSVNVFGWRPSGAGSVGLRAVVEPIDEAGTPVRKFESAVDRVPYWRDPPILSFDYYFLRVKGSCEGVKAAECVDWSEDMAPSWRGVGQKTALEGAVFTTQNFPVIETQARPMGDLWIDEPGGVGPCEYWGEDWQKFDCYDAGTSSQRGVDEFLGELLYEEGRHSYADVIVGFVPPGFSRRWTGAMVAFRVPGKRVVLLELNAANAGTVAHEFGHFFELGHCPSDEKRGCPYQILGFRISPSGRGGFNKHHLEGNQEAPPLAPFVPLMHWRQQPVWGQFIRTADYRALFEAIQSAPRREARRGHQPDVAQWVRGLLRMPVAFAQAAEPAPDSTLFVRGSIHGETVRLERLVLEAKRADIAPPVPEGPFRLHLLDSAGAPLAVVPFGPLAADVWHGGLEEGPRPFRVEVLAPAGLHAVRITRDGRTLAEQTRSANVPDIRNLSARREANGAVHVAWDARDADGDALAFDVEVRGADEQSWRRVALAVARQALVIEAGSLPPGPDGLLRVRASDGFNARRAEVKLPAQRPLAVLSTSPGPDAAGVSVQAEILVQLSNALRISRAGPLVPIQSGALRLTDPHGREVLADAVYRRDVATLILAPVVPLQPGTRYTVTLAAGLEDRWGGRLADALTWSFVTEDETVKEEDATGRTRRRD